MGYDAATAPNRSARQRPRSRRRRLRRWGLAAHQYRGACLGTGVSAHHDPAGARSGHRAGTAPAGRRARGEARRAAGSAPHAVRHRVSELAFRPASRQPGDACGAHSPTRRQRGDESGVRTALDRIRPGPAATCTG